MRLPALSSRSRGNSLPLLVLSVACVLALSSASERPAQWAREFCSRVAGRSALPYGRHAPAPVSAMATYSGAAASASAPLSTTTRPATRANVISCEPLPEVPGKSLTTMIVDFPPLAHSGPHRHPGSVTAIVLQGSVRSQMEGGPALIYQQGQTWNEAPRALHLLAENPDALKPAQLLAIFVTDSNCGPLVIPEPAAS